MQCVSDLWVFNCFAWNEQAQFAYYASEENMSPCWLCRVSGVKRQGCWKIRLCFLRTNLFRGSVPFHGWKILHNKVERKVRCISGRGFHYMS